jgi:Spy/CpxP family protein refolding chaperone
MKPLGLCVVAAALVLSFATHSFAQAPTGTPTPAMPEKGEMKGEMKGGMKGEMKKSDGMEKKSDGMMEKKSP